MTVRRFARGACLFFYQGIIVGKQFARYFARDHAFLAHPNRYTLRRGVYTIAGPNGGTFFAYSKRLRHVRHRVCHDDGAKDAIRRHAIRVGDSTTGVFGLVRSLPLPIRYTFRR